MKTQLKKLNRISKIECLNSEKYYCITIRNKDIQLQGQTNDKLVLQITKLFGKGKVSEENGYVYFYRNGIKIVLTE